MKCGRPNYRGMKASHAHAARLCSFVFQLWYKTKALQGLWPFSFQRHHGIKSKTLPGPVGFQPPKPPSRASAGGLRCVGTTSAKSNFCKEARISSPSSGCHFRGTSRRVTVPWVIAIRGGGDFALGAHAQIFQQWNKELRSLHRDRAFAEVPHWASASHGFLRPDILPQANECQKGACRQGRL